MSELTAPSDCVDVAIVGAGPTGQAMALALARMFEDDIEIALIDRAIASSTGNSAGSAAADPRAWALSAASVRFLKALAVWSAVEPWAQAVTEIDITDSSLDAGIRPILLSYDNITGDGEAAAWIVPNTVLRSALAEALARCPQGVVRAVHGRAVAGLGTSPSGRRLLLEDGHAIEAGLLVAADGRRSALRARAGIRTVRVDYDQVGIVTTVSLERPHGGRAVQHFLPGGPFAILPLPGDLAAVTWSEERAAAERILAGDDAAFTAEVQRRFGGRLGRIAVAGPRAGFPLATEIARSFIADGVALVGDAARTVHPIAGQGLNLAFRDCAALAECAADSASAGLSLGEPDGLERYQRWRRFDSALSAGAFHALNRLFSNDVTLLRSAREVGLGMVDRSATLKRFFVTEAAGLSGDLPALMRY